MRQKLTDQEFLLVKQARDAHSRLVVAFGHNGIQQQMLTDQRNDLTIQLNGLKIDQDNLMNDLMKKYGVGEIDMETGEFVGNE